MASGRTLRTLNIDLTRDLKLAGMEDYEVCAWGYFEALRQHCEQISVIHPGGWERTYSMEEVRAMLMRTPNLQGEVNMGRSRIRQLRQFGQSE